MSFRGQDFIDRALECRCGRKMEYSESHSKEAGNPVFICQNDKVYASFTRFDPASRTWEVHRGPLPGGGVCDFCTKPDPAWEFPCESFEHIAYAVDDEGVERHPDDHGSIGNWAACDECRALIESNERRLLAERSYDRAKEIAPSLNSMREILISGLMDLHRGFFDRRTGPPVPIDWSRR